MTWSEQTTAMAISTLLYYAIMGHGKGEGMRKVLLVEDALDMPSPPHRVVFSYTATPQGNLVITMTEHEDPLEEKTNENPKR